MAKWAWLSAFLLASSLAQSQLYLNRCAACHGVNGEGVEGIFPALAGSPLVVGATPELIEIVLTGRGGMPGWSSLADPELAEILTYIRQNFGNSSTEVVEAEVKEVRGQKIPVTPTATQGH